MRRNWEDQNLLTLVPVQNQESEVNGEKVIILLPKFRHPWLRRVIVPRLKKPFFRIELDEIGSAVWQAMDGKRTVQEIASILQDRFGDGIEPVYDRLGIFLSSMLDGDMIRFAETEGETES